MTNPTRSSPPNHPFSSSQLEAVRAYIKQTWKTLTRTPAHTLEAAIDPKIDHQEGQPWFVYISRREDLVTVRRSLQMAMTAEEFQQLEIRVLPPDLEHLENHGLLYLPGNYVVPGGRFNEMYGWDSYFIQLGLLRDREIELSQSLLDQLLYEIDHYGTILNGNRTYMLTRSQPPFITQMVLNQYQSRPDQDWLASVLPIIRNYYYYWIVPPHLNQATGLSRYYALGNGPAPEVIASERDQGGRTHYDRVREYYRTHQIEGYDVRLYYDQPGDRLTDLFYKGDRSMRESGLDPTNRFGPFSIDIVHYAPVCLNVLLYQMEQDIAQINEILGHADAVKYWRARAKDRHELIDQFLWDEEIGLYFDYNFFTERRRRYDYVTTFYPLWTGLASPVQAERVANHLSKFETCGGLRTSTEVTGNQWDAPFGWAPFHLIAVQGLYRYGYREMGDRIADKFITLLLQEFDRQGTLLEKYDVESCSSEISEEIQFGYTSNEEGFGWTNGVLLELLALRQNMICSENLSRE